MSHAKSVTDTAIIGFSFNNKEIAQKLAYNFAIIAIATSVTALLVYSIITHSVMNKLIADPSLAALTKERFFTMLAVTGTVIGISALTIIAIKIHRYSKFL